MKKSKIILICVAAAVVLACAALCAVAVHDASKNSGFKKNTYINGIDCSNLSLEQAEEKLVKEWNGKEYVIKDKASGDNIGTITDFGFEYDITDELKEAQGKIGIDTVLSYYGIGENNIEIPMTIEKYGKGFIKKLKKLDLPDSEEKKVKTKNAYISTKTVKFDIVPEVYGNIVSKARLGKKIGADIEQGVFLMKYDKEDFYVQPEVKKDDSALIEKQEKCKELLNVKIDVNYIYRTATLTEEQLKDMVDPYDVDSVVSKKKVGEYVNDNAPSAEYKYSSHSGKSGYALDRVSLIDELYELLVSGEDGTCKVKYTSGRVAPGNTDTYVEVDISKQHLWFMYEGKLIVETDVVTGNVAMNDDTPTGLYSIYAMISPKTLRGLNDDGTEYASDVTYWMPFNGGVGLHDASWKSVYGGTEYLNNGSHGCVNMPLNAAKKTYENISVGTAVLVHP